MKKKFHSLQSILLCSVSICCGVIMDAQSRQITGRLLYDQKPISDVLIREMGGTILTRAGADGRFQLSVEGESAMLVLEHPQYGIRRVAVGKNNFIEYDFFLKENYIEEVVLNAGYYKVKERERTGSIARISAKDIENQPVNNVLQAAQGRMAGVSIVQNSGVPGGGFDVQIRGRNSVRSFLTGGYDGNVPLYIIDGVPVASLKEYRAGLTGAIFPNSDYNPLNTIHPNDIESIEVLKDADATAIYGSKGANGVILVTTKRGKSGRTVVNLDTSLGLGTTQNLPKMMSTSEYLKMRREGFINDGVSTYPSTHYDINGRWDADRNTDWQKYFVGNTAVQQNTQMGVMGGSEQTSFSISGSHTEESTVFPGDYRYKRSTLNANVDHTNAGRNFKINFNTKYSNQNNFVPPTDFNRVYTSIAPNAPSLFTANGGLNWEDSTFSNPLAAASQEINLEGDHLVGNIGLWYKIIEGLSIKIDGGYGWNENKEEQIFPTTFYNPVFNTGSDRSALVKSTMSNKNWILEPQLNYDKKLGRHHISTLVGTSFQEQKSRNLTIRGSNFPTDDLIRNIGSASAITISSAYDFKYRYQAVYTRLNYQYDDRYILNLTGRRDGSSRFGEGKRYANFGAIGAAWIFSEDRHLKDLSWLSFGKIRASYGIAGNDQIGDYQFYDTYSTNNSNYNGISGMIPTRLYNSEFGWESTKKFEVALDTQFFNDRLMFSSSWYRNTSSNQLVGVPLPSITGFTSIQSNLDAVVLNKGLEFVLQGHPVSNENWNWKTSLNITFPENKLLRFPYLKSSTYSSYFEEGYSTSLKKLYEYTGIDPVTGLYTFRDFNEDGIINSSDKLALRELKEYWYGGLQNSIRYKNWDLDILIQFVRQNQNNMYSSGGYVGGIGNRSVEFLDYWSLENPDAKFQKPTAGFNPAATSANSNFLASTAGVSDATTLRLKNVSLSYTLPRFGENKLKAKLYFQAQNLLKISNFKGVDPEFIVAGYTTPLRFYSLGFQISY